MTAEQLRIATLSREARLVMLAARRDERAADSMCALLADGGAMDWPLVAGLAHRERAVPVVWRRLSSLPCASLAAPGAAGLERTALSYEFKMLYLRQRLEQTLAALAAASIPAVLLKGAALAFTVYRSLTERPMADLDLLVPRERADEAREVALSVGWGWRHDAQLDDFYATHHHLAPLTDPKGMGVALELHTALFFEGHPFRFTPEMIWRDAIPVEVGGVPALVPSMPHLLLHLCLHLAWSHGFEEGVWRGVRDVDAVVTDGRLDWDAFSRLAVDSRAASACFWTLRLTRALLDTSVPSEVLRALRPRLPESAVRAIERHYLSSMFSREDVCPSVRVRELVWRAAIQPGRSGHGGVLPWSRGDDFTPTPKDDPPPEGAAEPVSSGGGPMRHVRNLGVWGRYLRTLLG